MNYFDYLRATGKADTPDEFVSFLIEVSGYSEHDAQLLARILY